MIKDNSNKRVQISVPVIKDGKDICRLIFTEKDNNLFDLKIDFFNKHFEMLTYPAFCIRPIVQNVDFAEDVDLSYHPATSDGKGAIIHIKDKAADDNEQTYYDVIASNLRSPSSNAHFPIPLLKLEVPQAIIDESSCVKQKKKYHPIDLKEFNVVEIFIGAPDSSAFIDKFQTLAFVQTMLSFEYFATDTVLSDYQKNRSSKLNRGVFLEDTAMKLNDMSLYAVAFPDERIDDYGDRIKATVIANEYSEDILLTTLIKGWENESTWMGSAPLKEMKLPYEGEAITLINDSAAYWSCIKDHPSREDAEKLLIWQIEARKRLVKVESDLFDAVAEEKKSIEEKCRNFRRLFNKARTELWQAKGNSFDLMSADELLVASPIDQHEIEWNLLFARYCGLHACCMYGREIYSKNYSAVAADNSSVKYISKAGDSYTVTPRSLETTKFFHVILQYSNMIDVDLFRDWFNGFRKHGEPIFDFPEVMALSRYSMNFDNEWSEAKIKFDDTEMIIGENIYHYFNKKEFTDAFVQNNGRLQRVYDKLCSFDSNAK